ncbi:MAG: nucleotide exchange factor GrpE [Devosiaceae bacterium]|nr:nucleotide exchange factor GrpE [Devosiaceae bacterium MH13]
MSGADKSAEQRAAEDAAAAIHADEAAEAAEEAIAEALDMGEDEARSGWQAPPSDEPDFPAVIGALQDELEQMREQRLRDAAEMENLRRRTAREVMDAKKFAISGFARDLLSVSDNLTRAIGVVNAEERTSAPDVWRNLLEGVEMTERELLSVLDKNGIRRIDPRGEKFDPNKHQAMFEVPDPNQPAGMVTEVVAPGFLIGDRVLRPAMVGVSKGGPKVAPVSPGKHDATPEAAPAAPGARDGETLDKSV